MRQITAVEQFVAKMAHLFPSSYGTRTLLILLDCDRKPTVYTTIARLLFHYTNRSNGTDIKPSCRQMEGKKSRRGDPF